jgi:hypothetical protein
VSRLVHATYHGASIQAGHVVEFRFNIVGPGAINGHVGWAAPGTEVGSYAGLEAHHGYTVTFTPYTAKNGSPIPGANPGKVYFVS